MTDLTEQEIAEGERLLALPGPEFARWFVGREDRTFATLRADRARIAELEAQLAERTRERDVARLYCAEVASYVCDPMYDKVENRAGIAADAEAMATGEMTGRYLDIKTQTNRAIKAEAERDALRALLADARAVIAPPSVRFEAGYPLPAHLRMTAERAQLIGRIDAAIDAARANEQK